MAKILIPIIGKSASGKDTALKQLYKEFKKDYDVSVIVSDTTRPPRDGECNGIDYNFITKKEFKDGIDCGDFFEWNKFRGWYYGTRKTAILDNKINLGVFNARGLKPEWKNDFVVMPIYLTCPLGERLKRSYNRENKWKFEYIRRIIADFFDFFNIQIILNSFPLYIKINTKTGKSEIKVNDIKRAKLYNINLLDFI